jgi:hypothetical protein
VKYCDLGLALRLSSPLKLDIQNITVVLKYGWLTVQDETVDFCADAACPIAAANFSSPAMRQVAGMMEISRSRTAMDLASQALT